MASHDEIKRIIDESNENIAQLFRSLNLEPFEDNLTQMTSSLTEPVSDNFKKINDAIKHPLEKILDNIYLDRTIQNFEKSAEIMFDNGWWLIPTMPVPFYTQLVGVEDVNKKDLTDFIVKYYNENDCIELVNVIKGWTLDEFKENKEIFEDSLWAHKKSKFTLTVPTLAVQVEATLRIYYDPEFKTQIDGYREKLKKEYNQTVNNENLSYVDIFDNFTKRQNIKFLEDSVNEYVQSFMGEKRRDFDDIHRNPLLHGQCKNYTIEMSTKLFLFLDMIHYILDDLKKSNKKS